RSPRPPGEAEEARVEPEQPALLGAGDEERAHHPHDGDSVGEDGRPLSPDVVGDGPGEDGARDGEKAAHPEHGGRVQLVEPDVDGEGELMQGHEKATQSRAEVDGKEEPEVTRAYRVLDRPVVIALESGIVE